MMKTYLCVVSPSFPENYHIGLTAGKWGVEERYHNRIKDICEGDELVFIQNQTIRSIHKIESAPFYEDELLWPPKGGDRFPWRVRISEPIYQGAIAKDIFKDTISFMIGKVWGGTIQGASGIFNNRLTEADVKFIKSQLKVKKANINARKSVEHTPSKPSKMFKILGDDVLGALNAILPSLGLKRYNGADFPAEYDLGYGGNIILCRDLNTADLVVLDFISGDAADQSLLRLLHYMSWTRQNLAKSEDVRGFILCESSNKDLEAMVSEVPNIQIARYRLGIELLETGAAS